MLSSGVFPAVCSSRRGLAERAPAHGSNRRLCYGRRMRTRGWSRGRVGVLLFLGSGASVTGGCGRSIDHVDGAGPGPTGGSGAGGSAGSGSTTGGAGVGGAGMGGAGQGGSSGGECQAIQAEVRLAVDLSCNQDGDCTRLPHMMGDCTDCGVVTNVSSSESSLDTVRSMCQPFYEAGCAVPPHSCPVYRPSCVAGVCSQ